MKLSEQQITRRENLQKIADLGFETYPAAMVNVDFKSTDFTTEMYHANLLQKLEAIKGVGAAGAKILMDGLFNNRFSGEKVLANAEIMAAVKISETIEFDGDKRESMSFVEYCNEIKVTALGDFQRSGSNP